MTKYVSIIAVSLVALCNSAFGATLITGFGTSELNPFNTATDFLPSWTGTQTSLDLSISSQSNQSGGIFATLPTPRNITGDTDLLQLTGSLVGGAPATTTFQITLYDATFDSISYNFSWSDFASGPQTVAVPIFATSGTFDGTVTSWGLTLFGSPGETVSFTFDALTGVAIPEPTTAAMMVGALSLLALRRRQH